jgi:hypothetical protein
MNDWHKLTAGIVFLLLALALITAGCGVTWGTTGALIGSGLVCGIYGFTAFSTLSK